MSKYIVTSDWHIQNAGNFAKPEARGLTSRALGSLRTIEQLGAISQEKEIKKWLVCGDIFSTKSSVHTSVYNELYSVLEDVYLSDLELYMIPGNHDMFMRKGGEGINTLTVLADAVSNIDLMDSSDNAVATIKCSQVMTDLEFIVGVPPGMLSEVAKNLHTQFPPIAKRKPICMMLHENIIGAEFPSGAKADKGVTIKELKEFMAQFDIQACFCGDIHKPQIISQEPLIVIVGAPYQMDFGDAGQERGYWEYDSETNYAEFFPLPLDPAYIIIESHEMEDFKAIYKPDTTRQVYYWFKVSDTKDFEWVTRTFKDQDKQVSFASERGGSTEWSIDAFLNPLESSSQWVGKQNFDFSKKRKLNRMITRFLDVELEKAKTL